MKQFLLCGILILLCASSTVTHHLTVEVSFTKAMKGKVMLGIYREKDQFPKQDTRYKWLVITPHGTSAVGVFTDLPKGKYAVAAYLDENKNLHLDKNMVGYPTEPFGFSNNARVKFSAPTFEEAAIELHADRKIQIKLQ
jgi:uncharacterized protein (DUF2141 family)